MTYTRELTIRLQMSRRFTVRPHDQGYGRVWGIGSCKGAATAEIAVIVWASAGSWPRLRPGCRCLGTQPRPLAACRRAFLVS